MEDKEGRALSADVLKHTLAFRGNSAQLFSDALQEVQRRIQSGGELFPPSFTSCAYPDEVHTFKPVATSDTDSPLNPDEAVAAKILLDEGSALMQSLGKNSHIHRQLIEIMGLSRQGWPFDAIDAMHMFGIYLGLVANIRERIKTKELIVNPKTIGDVATEELQRIFVDPLKKDGLEIGENTADAIVEVVAGFAQRDIPNNPEGARTPEKINERIISAIRGAQLAKDLYLEAKGLASKVLN